MSTVVHVGIVPKDVTIAPSEVADVAAALSIQVARDFTPIWNIQATVSAFPDPSKVPLGYWPIFILDPKDLPPDEGGVHLDKNNQPYSLIESGAQWSLDASHECLEMLVDPAGNKVHANPMLQQAIALGQPDHQVQYIVEVCDPIEDAQYAYQINGVIVSDFITPHFYDPLAVASTSYDFTGFIKAPRQVLTNGYISWIDPTDGEARQLLNFVDPNTGKLTPQIRDLGKDARYKAVLQREALRPAIDRVTGPLVPDLLHSIKGDGLPKFAARRQAAHEAAGHRAQSLQEEISGLRKG